MAGRKPSKEARSDDPAFTDTDWMPPPVRPDLAGTAAATSVVSINQGPASGTVPGTETVTYAGSGLVFVSGLVTRRHRQIIVGGRKDALQGGERTDFLQGYDIEIERGCDGLDSLEILGISRLGVRTQGNIILVMQIGDVPCANAKLLGLRRQRQQGEESGHGREPKATHVFLLARVYCRECLIVL